MRLRFTRTAGRNLDSIATYIAKDNPRAAESVGTRIVKACELLTTSPFTGRPGIRSRTRELSVRGLPYIVVYRVLAEEILVLGVYHERQLRPGQSER